jgi:hypothetical protein
MFSEGGLKALDRRSQDIPAAGTYPPRGRENRRLEYPPLFGKIVLNDHSDSSAFL